MTAAGLWMSRRERKRQLHQPRGRRDCFGELVKIDGSRHWWVEERGPKCALLVYIDDATGKLLHLRFAGSENTFEYFYATKAFLQEWGKPLAFYSDKHGVFRTTHGSEKDRSSGLTQFGRALYELNIDIICVNTPQARGRVERANRTLQDRLVKELQLRAIDTIEAANVYAPEYIADFNTRFGKEPRNPKDKHRPLAAHENIDGLTGAKLRFWPTSQESRDKSFYDQNSRADVGRFSRQRSNSLASTYLRRMRETSCMAVSGEKL